MIVWKASLVYRPAISVMKHNGRFRAMFLRWRFKGDGSDWRCKAIAMLPVNKIATEKVNHNGQVNPARIPSNLVTH